MERLTGIDAGFLYMETPTLHMHTLKISIVDPATVPGGYSFWELWVVEGIAHGHIGFVAKIHHAAADGVAAAAMLANVLEAEADPEGRPEADPGGRPEGKADPGPVAPPSAPWRPEPIPPP